MATKRADLGFGLKATHSDTVSRVHGETVVTVTLGTGHPINFQKEQVDKLAEFFAQVSKPKMTEAEKSKLLAKWKREVAGAE